MHLGSIAPIGHSKIFYFMTLVLVYSVFEAELKKVEELLSWFLIIFYSVYLGLQRTDQVVSFAFIASGLSIIHLLRIKFQSSQLNLNNSQRNYLRPFLVFGSVVISLLTTLLQSESKKTMTTLTDSVTDSVTDFLWQVLAQPFYLFLDLAPTFMPVSSPKVNMVRVAIISIIVPTVLYYCHRCVPKIRLISNLLPIFCAYVLFVSYGAAIGPRVEIRYIMALLLFGFFVIVTEFQEDNTVLEKRVLLGLISSTVLLYSVVFLPHILKSERVFLFGTIFNSKIAAEIWSISLFSTFLNSYNFLTKSSGTILKS